MSINLFLQDIATPFWDKFFLYISSFTNEYIYVGMIIFIYYFADKRKGIKAAFAVVSSLMINFLLKNIFAVPRPYIKNRKIICKDPEQGYGYSLPSGHSQLNSGFFTTVHRLFGGKKLVALSVSFVLLTAFSRLYLGVHTLSDVAAGLALGFIWSVTVLKYIDIILCEKKYILFIFSLVGIIDVILYKNADSIKILFLYYGFVTGFILEERYVQYANAKKKSVRLIECLFCFAGIIIIRILFKKLLPDVKYIHYLMIGIWA